MTPEKLSGKEFESRINDRAEWYFRRGLAHITRYGMHASIIPGSNGTEWRPRDSLPDYEGVQGDARQVIFDAKVCSQASFALDKYTTKVVNGRKKRGARRRQLEHMLNRSKFGVACGFLIHWNARALKTKIFPQETFWFPVLHNSFWRAVERRSIKSISRSDCRFLGLRVDWGVVGRQSTSGPDILGVLKELTK